MSKMTEQEVREVVTPLIRKYDWHTEQYGWGVKLIVTDGVKKASVVITTGENIEDECRRLIEAVDAHQYGDLEG